MTFLSSRANVYFGFPGVSFTRLESKTILERTLGHLSLAHVTGGPRQFISRGATEGGRSSLWDARGTTTKPAQSCKMGQDLTPPLKNASFLAGL